jgi:hypothetical protein
LSDCIAKEKSLASRWSIALVDFISMS